MIFPSGSIWTPRAGAILLLIAAAPFTASAATVELGDPDQPVSLAVAWKFQPGDDPAWANPERSNDGRMVIIARERSGAC